MRARSISQGDAHARCAARSAAVPRRFNSQANVTAGSAQINWSSYLVISICHLNWSSILMTLLVLLLAAAQARHRAPPPVNATSAVVVRTNSTTTQQSCPPCAHTCRRTLARRTLAHARLGAGSRASEPAAIGSLPPTNRAGPQPCARCRRRRRRRRHEPSSAGLSGLASSRGPSDARTARRGCATSRFSSRHATN